MLEMAASYHSWLVLGVGLLVTVAVLFYLAGMEWGKVAVCISALELRPPWLEVLTFC